MKRLLLRWLLVLLVAISLALFAWSIFLTVASAEGDALEETHSCVTPAPVEPQRVWAFDGVAEPRARTSTKGERKWTTILAAGAQGTPG